MESFSKSGLITEVEVEIGLNRRGKLEFGLAYHSSRRAVVAAL
jgi:hypothetical protein